MKISFNGSLGTLNQINRTTQKTQKVFEQLSSGKKINRAGDNPAASALINSLKSNLSGLQTANKNISSAKGALSIASGAVSSSVEQLQSMRDLAVQASNGTLSSSDRAALNSQFQQGVQSIDQVASTSEFNGTKLLDGSFNSTIQSGANAGETTSVSIGSVSSSSLGVSGQNLSTQEGASDAIEAIDTALASALREQSKIGAAESALEFRENANAIAAENIESARSQAEDTDFAEATSDLSRQNVLKEAQIAVLKAQIQQQTAVAKQLFSDPLKK